MLQTDIDITSINNVNITFSYPHTSQLLNKKTSGVFMYRHRMSEFMVSLHPEHLYPIEDLRMQQVSTSTLFE